MMFLIIILSGILGLIGTDIFVPSLPYIARVFHLPANYAQLTISLFLASFAVSQLFYGPISDRYGRKPVLICGVACFVLGSLVCIEASSFIILCLGRIIQGVGVGAGLSIARVILRDCYAGKELAIKSSQIAIFICLTPAVAPLIGGVLQQQWGFHASFVFMLGYGLILLLLLITLFKETIQQKDEQLTVLITLKHYAALIQKMDFMRYAIISGLAFASIIVYANVTPFIIQDELQLSATTNGMVLLISAFGLSIGSIISSRMLSMVITSKQLIHWGLAIYVVNGLILIIVHHVFGNHLFFIIVPLFFITVGCGFIFPNALAVCFSQINCNIGIAGSIYGAMQTFISMLINFLLNLIAHQNQTVLGLFYLFIGLAGVTLSFVQVNKLFTRVYNIKSGKFKSC